MNFCSIPINFFLNHMYSFWNVHFWGVCLKKWDIGYLMDQYTRSSRARHGGAAGQGSDSHNGFSSSHHEPVSRLLDVCRLTHHRIWPICRSSTVDMRCGIAQEFQWHAKSRILKRFYVGTYPKSDTEPATERCIYPRTGDFRHMVSSAVWVKRLRRDKENSLRSTTGL